ncbi:MAG TPA: hypothetical protein PKY50_15345 [Candidatus Competibacter sp.]|nr:hypothetical protein [Candidatus Competibacter sp.]
MSQHFFKSERIPMRLRLFAWPAWLAFIMIWALLGVRAVVAAQPAAGESQKVCSEIPTEIGNVLDPGVATPEDVQAFRKAVAPLRAELDALCKKDQAAFKLFKTKAKKVVFEMSAGATEPTAYLKEGYLVVEFYGGTFDARSFRQIVKKVLQGRKIPLGD